MKNSWALALASAVILALGAIPANAQPFNRTWVSATTGVNSGTCGPIASPCLTFAGALANTAAGGEIDCLTPGDFGPVTVSQSVSIICDGVSHGGILTSTNIPAITINAGSGGVVYLSGLDLEGAGTGLEGVLVNSGLTVYITHSTIRSFNGFGVYLGTGTTTRVVIKDSIIVNNVSGAAVSSRNVTSNALVTVNTVIDGSQNYAAVADNIFGSSSIALIRTLLTGSQTSLALLSGATGFLIGPSNTITGAINGSPTSVPFK